MVCLEKEFSDRFQRNLERAKRRDRKKEECVMITDIRLYRYSGSDGSKADVKVRRLGKW